MCHSVRTYQWDAPGTPVMIIRRVATTVGHPLLGITGTIRHHLPVFVGENMTNIGVDLLCLTARDTRLLQTTEVAILHLMQIIAATVVLLYLLHHLTTIAMREDLVVRDSLLDTCLLGVGGQGLHPGIGKISRECLPTGEMSRYRASLLYKEAHREFDYRNRPPSPPPARYDEYRGVPLDQSAPGRYK